MCRWLTLSFALGLGGCALAGLANSDAPPGGITDASHNGDDDASHVTTDAHGNNDGSSSGSCAMTFTGVLATWNLSSAPGDQTSTPATSSAAGGTASAISRSSGVVATAGAGSINSNNWATGGSIDTTKYYTVSITPPSGCNLALTSASIDSKASGTGPSSGAVATSDDSFGQDTPITVSTVATPTLSASGTGAIEVRIYGYSASSMSGTFRVQNTLTVSGKFE